jgi:DNA-binding IclR family transcriptional regulator
VRNLPARYLADLRDRSVCTASIAVLDGNDIVYVDRARSASQGQSEVAVRLGPGSRVPAASAALGRMLLAYAPREERLQAIDAYAEDPASKEWGAERKRLVDELERIREKGFAIADQVRIAGHRCVAAPLRSRSSEVIAAVELSAAKAAFSRGETIERLAPLVVASAAEMSAYLGHAPAG